MWKRTGKECGIYARIHCRLLSCGGNEHVLLEVSASSRKHTGACQCLLDAPRICGVTILEAARSCGDHVTVSGNVARVLGAFCLVYSRLWELK